MDLRSRTPGPEGGGGGITPELATQMLEAVGQAVIATDISGMVIYWNPAAERLYGWSSEEALGRQIMDLVVPAEELAGAEEVLDAVRRGERRVVDAELVGKGDRRLQARVVDTPIYGGDGAVVGIVGVSYDISRRRRAEEELRASETRFRALVSRSSDVAMIFDRRGRFVYVSPAITAISGHLPEELLGTDGFDLVHPEDAGPLMEVLRSVPPGESAVIELRLRMTDGTWRWVEETATNLTDEPAISAFVANVRDISERKLHEAELERQAHYDELTGLPNRAKLDVELLGALGRGGGVAVLVLDIDQFKLINDSYGHSVGDELLARVSQRLQHALRPGDLAGRFGGDEFVVVCSGITDAVEAAGVAERLQRVLEAPFDLEGVGTVYVSASIGIAVGETGASSHQLIHDADAAMYSAKRAGRARHAVYDDAMREEAARRLLVETELRTGLACGEITAHYQPILDLRSGEVVALEALARWEHPVKGTLGTAEFLEVAEESGLIVPLGRQVLEQAVVAAAAWRAAGHTQRVAVNLAAVQLADPELVGVVAELLSGLGLRPGALVLEIREAEVMADPARATEVLSRLAELGVLLALDDFGAGHASLTNLRELPVRAVKIDGTVVAGAARRGTDRDALQAIAKLAQAFGRDLVAEGVETSVQLEVLRGLGCRFGQGFLWSPPLPVEQIRAGAAGLSGVPRW